eukprot:6209180-Pleurochrysis_carterae.AAC.2
MGCDGNNHAFRRSMLSRVVAETTRLIEKATSEVLPWLNSKDNRLTTYLLEFCRTTTTTALRMLR